MEQEVEQPHSLHYSIKIEAASASIWKVLWEDQSYKEWASVFFEGTYFICHDWKEGETIHFLDPNKNGIYSKIEQYIQNETVAFKHIGNVLNGKEQVVNESTQKWSETTEIYRLTPEANGHIVLSITIDVLDEHLAFMKEKLPLALEKIKELSTKSKFS